MALTLSHGRELDVTGVGIDQSELPAVDAGRLDLRAWFAQPTVPLELEIGSGKGTFLVQHATALRDAGVVVNFLGIEWARAFWRYAADRVRRHGLGDRVKLVRAEAGAFVRSFVPDATFRCVHVYFPDPWPKARHHKRRLIQAPFLRELHRVLTADGQVRLATDHGGYFAWMREHAAAVADGFTVEPFDRPASAGEGELVGTNFERKYRREGRPFHAMVLRRRGHDAPASP